MLFKSTTRHGYNYEYTSMQVYIKNKIVIFKTLFKKTIKTKKYVAVLYCIETTIKVFQ